MLDYDAGQIALRHAGNSGIKVLTLSDLTEIDSKEGKIIAVKIESRGEVKSEQWLPCNLLICAKGVNPNVGMLQGTEVKINQGIVTNPKMQTNIENIYAAGDVAETFDIATETNSINALWTCAVQQGKIAGYNMAGKEKNYDGSIGMNSINFPGLDIISFGVVKTKDEQGYETIVLNLPDSNIYKKIILNDNKIKGLILVNDLSSAGLLLSLLGRKIEVSAFKDELLSNKFSLGNILRQGETEEWARMWCAGHIKRESIFR
jgi:NAD(P)H-nitrite reductase large subunit